MSDHPPEPPQENQPEPQPQGPAFELETPTYEIVEKGHNQSGLETRDDPRGSRCD